MYYFVKFCRLCLSFNGNFSTIYNENILKRVTACIGDFKLHHNLPSLVCHDCLEKLDLFFSFKKRCLRSEYLISLYIEKLYQLNSLEDFTNTDLRVNVINNIAVSPIKSYRGAKHVKIHRKNGLRKGKKPSFLMKNTSIVLEESSKVDDSGNIFIEKELAFSDRNRNHSTNTLKRKSHSIELPAKKIKLISNIISDVVEHTLTSNNKSAYDENLSDAHFHKVYKGPRNLKPILNERDEKRKLFNVHFKNNEVFSLLEDLSTSGNYVKNIDKESKLHNENLTDVNVQVNDSLALSCNSTTYIKKHVCDGKSKSNIENGTKVYIDPNELKKLAQSCKTTKANDFRKFYVNEKKIKHSFKIVYKDKSKDLTKSSITLNVSDASKKPTVKKTNASDETMKNKDFKQSQKLLKPYCASSTCRSKQHRSHFVNIHQGPNQLNKNVTSCIYTYDIQIPESDLAITTNTDLEEQIAAHQIHQSKQIEKPKIQVRNVESLNLLNENVAQKSNLKNTQLSNLKTTSADQSIHQLKPFNLVINNVDNSKSHSKFQYIPILQPVTSKSILSLLKRQDSNILTLNQKSNSISNFGICALNNNKEDSSKKSSTTVRNEHSYSTENRTESSTDNKNSASKTANKEGKTFLVLSTPANSTQLVNLKDTINNTWSKYISSKKVDLDSVKTVGNTTEAIKGNSLLKSAQNTNASQVYEQSKTSETIKRISLLKSAQSANTSRISEQTVTVIPKEEIIPDFPRINTFLNFENEAGTIIKEEYTI